MLGVNGVEDPAYFLGLVGLCFGVEECVGFLLGNWCGLVVYGLLEFFGVFFPFFGGFY